jgi:hypothetical protein
VEEWLSTDAENQPKIKPKHARLHAFAHVTPSTMASITVKAPADFHVHLRQGEFSKLVTPHVRKGGFTLAYVMVDEEVTPLIAVILSTFRPAESQTACHNDRTSPSLQG